MEHVILYFVDHVSEHTTWEDLEECKSYVSEEYSYTKYTPRIYPVHFVKVNDPDYGEIFFRLGEANKDDWCVQRKGTYC